MVAWGWKIMEDHLNETGCNCFFLHGLPWHIPVIKESLEGTTGRHNWKAHKYPYLFVPELGVLSMGEYDWPLEMDTTDGWVINMWLQLTITHSLRVPQYWIILNQCPIRPKRSETTKLVLRQARISATGTGPMLGANARGRWSDEAFSNRCSVSHY